MTVILCCVCVQWANMRKRVLLPGLHWRLLAALMDFSDSQRC
jgi:hypothetical protein